MAFLLKTDKPHVPEYFFFSSSREVVSKKIKKSTLQNYYLFLSPINKNGHLVSKLGRELVQDFENSSLEGTREKRFEELRKVT